MSPSESELRAFLHGGEGEAPDADALIAHARAVRRGRRVRLASVAGAVIVVGAISAGAVALGGGSGHPTAGTPPGSTQPHATGSALPGAPNGPVPSHVAPSTGERGPNETCPAIPPHLMLPGGGGTGQFGGDGPLFDGTITSMQICGYAARDPARRGPGSGWQPARTALITDERAGEIATSLDAASTKPVIGKCVISTGRQLVIYAKTSEGVASKPVVVDYSSCTRTATNGTAVRYDWNPPTDVAPLLDAVTTPIPAITSGSTSFKPSGSPVR